MAVFDWVGKKLNFGLKGNKATGMTIAPGASIESFIYKHSGASLQSCFTYILTYCEDGSYVINLSLCRTDKYEPIIVGPEFANGLIQVLRDNKINEWHGFEMTDTKALDGSDFELDILFKDRRNISVRGFNTAPEGFDEGIKAILDYFEPVVDKRVPILPNK